MNMSRCTYIDMQEMENLGKSSTIEKQFLHFMANEETTLEQVQLPLLPVQIKFKLTR